MAISNACVWEVRITGNDNNGGGFVTGASGTDFSQQDAPQFALTGVTSAGAGSTFLTASAAASMVGNICRIVSGTDFTPGLYQITAVSVGVSVTVDRACATGAGSSGVINIGGSFASIQIGINAFTADTQVLYVRAATYALGAALTSISVPNFEFAAAIIGYSTTRGDNGKATVTTSGTNAFTFTHPGWKIMNFTVIGPGTTGISITGNYCGVFNCDVSNFATGLSLSGVDSIAFRVSVTTATTAGFTVSGIWRLISCNAFSNSCVGFNITGSGIALCYCVSINNTGATSDGFRGFPVGGALINCLAYGNGRDGLRLTEVYSITGSACIVNCILTKNVGFGINQPSSASKLKTTPATGWNGLWSNTAGAVNGYVLGSTDVSISGTDPTNDPFVNKAVGNFALNSTAGAGALLRAAGMIGVLNGIATTGYEDIGPFQHQDSGGAAGIIRNPEL